MDVIGDLQHAASNLNGPESLECSVFSFSKEPQKILEDTSGRTLNINGRYSLSG